MPQPTPLHRLDAALGRIAAGAAAAWGWIDDHTLLWMAAVGALIPVIFFLPAVGSPLVVVLCLAAPVVLALLPPVRAGVPGAWRSLGTRALVVAFTGAMLAAVGSIGVPRALEFAAPLYCPPGYETVRSAPVKQRVWSSSRHMGGRTVGGGPGTLLFRQATCHGPAGIHEPGQVQPLLAVVAVFALASGGLLAVGAVVGRSAAGLGLPHLRLLATPLLIAGLVWLALAQRAELAEQARALAAGLNLETLGQPAMRQGLGIAAGAVAASATLAFFGYGRLRLARQQRAARRAARELPALAERLGLHFAPPPHPDLIGTISGEFDGYTVRINPHDTPKFEIDLQRPPAPEEAAAHRHEDPLDALRHAPEDFRRRWGPRLLRFVVHGPRLRCTPREGTRAAEGFLGDQTNAPEYLTAAQVEALLPALVAIARRVDRG